MGVKNEQKIPILNPSGFSERYFRHVTREEVSAMQVHFDIQNRCIVKNQIPAHRLNFFMIFLVTSGEGVQSLGNSEYYLRRNALCFIGPNVINSWQAQTDEHQGYSISFTDDYFNEGLINRQLLCDLPFFQLDGNAVIYLTDEQAREYIILFKLMQSEYGSKNPHSPEVLRGYLHALVNKSRAYIGTENDAQLHKNNAGLRLIKAFTKLYMNDVNTIRVGKEIRLKKISEYAAELDVSANHLNDTIKSITGKSAGQLMRSQLVKQATMCIRHSSKTISEIAYLMGFEDPSYFSRFYKKETGKMPSDVRSSTTR